MTQQRVLLAVYQSMEQAALEHQLAQLGLAVLAAADGCRTLVLWVHEQPDLLVLDATMPQLDGLTLCQCIRRSSSVPIVMLGDSERGRADALHAGADAYLVQPIDHPAFAAKVRHLLTRVPKTKVSVTRTDLEHIYRHIQQEQARHPARHLNQSLRIIEHMLDQ